MILIAILAGVHVMVPPVDGRVVGNSSRLCFEGDIFIFMDDSPFLLIKKCSVF